MNKSAFALLWCAVGFTSGALATVRVPVLMVVGLGAVLLVIVLVCGSPAHRRKERSLKSIRKTPQSFSRLSTKGNRRERSSVLSGVRGSTRGVARNSR